MAAELGVPVRRVSRLLDERGVKRSRREVAVLANAARWEPAGDGPAPKRSNRWPPEEADEVVRRYAAGKSGEQIAESLGVRPGRVYRLLRRRGVLRSRVEARRSGEAPKPLRRVRELPADVAEEGLARYAAGEAAGYVAAALGVPAKRVYELLRERGVLRSKSEARKLVHAQRRAG